MNAITIPPYVRTPGKLSPRQIRMIRLAADGRSTEQIARSVNVSKRTVNNEFTHAFGVLNARNRTHLVAIAMRRRIIR